MDSKKKTHPLHQIADSPTHKLLLKQWLKESELVNRRSSSKQAQIDAVRIEITFLCSGFFVFHSLILLILFGSSSSHSCRRSWVPCVLSVASSMAMVWVIRYKIGRERHMVRVLEREVEDGMLLEKCVAELKKKGAEFDLLKEVDALRRAKSLRVDSKLGGDNNGRTSKFSFMDAVTVFFLAASCGILVLTRTVVCR